MEIVSEFKLEKLLLMNKSPYEISAVFDFDGYIVCCRRRRFSGTR